VQPASVQPLDAQRHPCRDVGKVIPFDGVQPRITPADCVVHIGTPDLRSPIMRRPHADCEDDPASGKRSTDAHRPTNGTNKVDFDSRAPHQPGEAAAFEIVLAKRVAIRRPHYRIFPKSYDKGGWVR
jgi:hypothetical protein